MQTWTVITQKLITETYEVVAFDEEEAREMVAEGDGICVSSNVEDINFLESSI